MQINSKRRHIAVAIMLAAVFVSVLVSKVSMCQEQKTQQDESTIQAATPVMPLLRDLLQIIESGEIPSVSGSINPLTNKPLDFINWKRDDIVQFNSKNSDKGTVYFVDYLSNGADEFTVLAFTDHDIQCHRNWSWEKDGILTTVSKTSFPVGIIWNPVVARKGGAGRIVRIGHQDAELIFTDLEPQSNHSCLNTLSIVPDGTGEGTVILYPATGKEMAKGPAIDFNIADTRQMDVATVGNDIYVGGVEEYAEEYGRGYGLFWSKLSTDRQRWKTTRKRLNSNYLKSILPKRFQKMGIVPVETLPHLWPDGSIIFRAVGKQSDAHESIGITCIIKQPLQGPPILLTWEIFYDYRDDEDKNAERTFDRFWYPIDGGKVESVYPDTSRRNELYFDIDHENNALIFLRGGQPWLLKMK